MKINVEVDVPDGEISGAAVKVKYADKLLWNWLDRLGDEECPACLKACGQKEKI